jgi:hypothetical protein
LIAPILIDPMSAAGLPMIPPSCAIRVSVARSMPHSISIGKELKVKTLELGRLLVLSTLLGASLGAFGYDSESKQTSTERLYTFAWPYVEGDAMAPRGGTSKGASVVLSKAPIAAWRALQAAKDDDKDRAAILAMAGSFRASFDFIEVAGFGEHHSPQQPYQSWGTERVVVLEDAADFISLQHILVMKMVGADGKVMGPFVTKHWRQDWQRQPRTRFDYLGDHQWQGKAIEASPGSWSQCVYQVDDSPRYCGVGSWQHSANYSTWVGDEGARPLPRREWSVRQDYGLLVGTNRHTITPTGWIHEQQNNKVTNLNEHRVLAREFGFNRYEAIDDPLPEAEAYIRATEVLWKRVRSHWAALLGPGQRVRLKGAPDQAKLYEPLFAKAEALQKDAETPVSDATVQTLVADYLAPEQTASTAYRSVEKPLPQCHAADTKACDRAAILHMAGDFAVGFNFQETVALAPNYQRRQPMHSDAFEMVRVIEDSPNKISLQHLLVSASGHVTKHWRQDWVYQLAGHWTFNGAQQFTHTQRAQATVAGTWTQLVYDVADAPRYAGSGRWNHKYGVSTWTSERTWRPLPRREYSTRDDYHLINAENRHTVTPSGWTHEQDNSKVVRSDGLDRTLVREFGFSDYRRIEGFDFAKGEAYWKRTATFWQKVRSAWELAINKNDSARLCYALNDEKPAAVLFEAAEQNSLSAIAPWMEQYVNCAADRVAKR